MTTPPDQPGQEQRLLLDIPAAVAPDALKVMLTEYKALRAEILNRAGAQSLLLQVHITTLTLILGAAATTHYAQWLLFLIPIESSVFGLWYLDHAVTISRIGDYIQRYTEPNVSRALLMPGIMAWENGFYGDFSLLPAKRPLSFERLLVLTFGGPCLLALVAGAGTIILSVGALRDALPSALTRAVPSLYGSGGLLLALAAFVVCLVGYVAYIVFARYHMQVVALREKSADSRWKERMAPEQ